LISFETWTQVTSNCIDCVWMTACPEPMAVRPTVEWDLIDADFQPAVRAASSQQQLRGNTPDRGHGRIGEMSQITLIHPCREKPELPVDVFIGQDTNASARLSTVYGGGSERGLVSIYGPAVGGSGVQRAGTVNLPVPIPICTK
jgi:hypothetical protein